MIISLYLLKILLTFRLSSVWVQFISTVGCISRRILSRSWDFSLSVWLRNLSPYRSNKKKIVDLISTSIEKLYACWLAPNDEASEVFLGLESAVSSLWQVFIFLDVLSLKGSKIIEFDDVEALFADHVYSLLVELCSVSLSSCLEHWLSVWYFSMLPGGANACVDVYIFLRAKLVLAIYAHSFVGSGQKQNARISEWCWLQRDLWERAFFSPLMDGIKGVEIAADSFIQSHSREHGAN